MNNHSNEPRPYDAVLGRQSPLPVTGAVLGGLEGVKQRLVSHFDETRIGALKDALNYGKPGKDLLTQVVKTQTGLVQWEAYELLWERTNPDERKTLLIDFPLRSEVLENGARSELWIPTDTEKECQRANRAESQLQQVVLNLLQQGMMVDQVARITGFSEQQVQRLSEESVE